jgi:hypothetical protein
VTYMKIFGIDIGEKKSQASGACCGPDYCSEPASGAADAEAVAAVLPGAEMADIGTARSAAMVGQSPDDIKAMVKEKYGALAAADEPGSSCCGAISTASGETACFSEGYSGLQG